MIGRMLRSADFERVLGTPSRARSPHFSVHYLRGVPSRSKKPGAAALVPELSTGQAPQQGPAVDDSVPDRVWFGVVVPKRHARRAVTRNLIKRQIREAVASADREAQLPTGLWVVRWRKLRAVRSPWPDPMPALPSANAWVLLPRRVLMTFVRGYRLFLSPWLGSACRFTPTCSAYALEALDVHGAGKGSYLTLRRIGRCHPWCAGGHDPVPPPAGSSSSSRPGSMPGSLLSASTKKSSP
jgi:uncharacterized protein